MLAPAVSESRARNSVKLVPASAKIEEVRREEICNLPESSLYTVADLQSFGFGLPTSLMNPPRSLFAAVRFSSIRPETAGTMARRICTGPGKGDGAGPGPDVEGGGANEGEGNTDSGVVRSGVGKIGTKDGTKVGIGTKVGTKVGTVTMDVIVVTTGYPPYGCVSRGAR